jgi:adenylate cyclase
MRLLRNQAKGLVEQKAKRHGEGRATMKRIRWTSFIPPLVLLGALFLDLRAAHLVAPLRNFTFDSYERLAPRPYQDAHVRIVDIDDETLAKLGQWPWPRPLIARVLSRLTELGAASIALDAVFAEPDRTSPRNIVPMWRELSTSLPDDLTGNLPDFDALLAKTIAETPTVLGIVLTNANHNHPPRPWGMAMAGSDVRPFLNAYQGAIENLPVLQAHAPGIGAFNSDADTDGIVRRVPLLFALTGAKSASEGIYPALSAEALRVAQRASTYIVKGTGASGFTAFGENVGVNTVKIGQAIVPTDKNASIQLYDTGSVPERTIPLWQILEPNFDRSRIEGNIIFIGTSAPGLGDQRTTPIRQFAPGVEVHAEAAEQMILGQYLIRPNYMPAAEALWLLILGGGLLLLLRGVGPTVAAIIGIVGIGGSFVVSWVAFRRFGVLVDPVYPAAAAFAIYLSQSLIHYVRTERDRRYIKNAFGLYISPAQVARLGSDPSKLKLGGEMREMTIMFCDIRGFTSLSETMNAEALTHFINGFLTPMTDIIQARNGTIDKYIGDCIMAFWNAPLDEPAHAELGVRAALEMAQDLVRLNQKWRSEAAAEGRVFNGIGIGIGLATGTCCVGNLGSDQRLNYSVLGDDVNLASRLEGQTKVYGMTTIISEATQEQLPDFATLELDLLRVKGKAQPRRIFGVLGDETVAAEEWFVTLSRDHHAMLAAYRRQDWPAAEVLLERLRGQARGDMHYLYDLYAERIADFRTTELPEDWDGVTVAKTK